MPKEIKIAIIILLVSSVFPFLGTFIESMDFPDENGYSMLMYGVDVFWLCIILWVVFGIKNRKDFRPTVLGVGVVMLFFLGWDYSDYGLQLSQFMYLIELLLFTIAWFILGKPVCRSWHQEKSI